MASFSSEAAPEKAEEETPTEIKRGGIFALGGLGGLGALKGSSRKTAPRVPFALKPLDAAELALQWRLSSTERMRVLDDLHRHAPLPDECLQLGIPDDRLDLHRTKDVLLLSGGCLGVRFSSDELGEIARLLATLSPLWDFLQARFAAMTSLQKKAVLSGGPYPTADAPEEWDEADRAAGEAVGFHCEADAYSGAMAQLQAVIRRKQAAIQRGSDGAQMKFDADPESLVGSPMPHWLVALLQKYHACTGAGADVGGSGCGTGGEAVTPSPAAAAAAAAASSAAAAPLTRADASALRRGVTIGKLAAFLSGCVVGAQTCSHEEWQSVALLLHASNDATTVLSPDCLVQQATAAADGSWPAHQPRPRSYWARRLFAFLSAVSELKTAARDEGSLSALG